MRCGRMRAALALGALACAMADEAFISWEESGSTASPSPRSLPALAHQRVLGPSGTAEYHAWLYGGLEPSLATSDELWRYDMAAGEWAQRTAIGDVPAGCHGCALVAPSSTALFLLMGASASGAPVRTVHRLDVSGALTWSLVTNSGPVARTGHTATAVEGGAAIVLIGGKAADGSTHNDVWRFDVSSASWAELNVSGAAPAARAAHSATAITETLVAVLAGRGANGEPLADLHLLDLSQRTWRAVSAMGGRAPAARSAHAAALVGRFLVVMHGLSAGAEPLADTWSADAFALLSGEADWRRAAAADAASAPAARWGHAAVGFGGQMLAYGGMATGTSASSKRDTWLLRPTCSGVRTLSVSSGVLTDGVGGYSQSLACAWLVAPSAPNVVVELTMLESELSDEADRVAAYDGASTDARLLLSHSGRALPATVASTGGSLFVTLTTGQLGAGHGFRAAWRAICAAGYEPEADGACVACKPGMFKARAGSHRCAACGVRAFTAGEGATECSACPRGSTAQTEEAGEASACKCDRGLYRRAGACVACELGATCAGGSSIEPRRGWCESSEGARTYEHCCEEAECSGGRDGVCAPGVRTMGLGAPGADPTPCATRVVAFSTLLRGRVWLAGEAWAALSAAVVLFLALAFGAGVVLGWRCARVRALARTRARAQSVERRPHARLLPSRPCPTLAPSQASVRAHRAARRAGCWHGVHDRPRHRALRPAAVRARCVGVAGEGQRAGGDAPGWASAGR